MVNLIGLKNSCILALLAALSACGSGAESSTSNIEQTKPDTGEATPGSSNGASTDTDLGCSAPSADIRRSTLQRVNEIRSKEQLCGNVLFKPAPAVTWNDKLAAAAVIHSTDMAAHNFFEHEGSNGLTVSERTDAQQYKWTAVGENIAAGQTTSDAAMDAWLASKSHCENLMEPRFLEFAVACVEDPNTDFQQYWTNVLGSTAKQQ